MPIKTTTKKAGRKPAVRKTTAKTVAKKPVAKTVSKTVAKTVTKPIAKTVTRTAGKIVAKPVAKSAAKKTRSAAPKPAKVVKAKKPTTTRARKADRDVEKGYTQKQFVAKLRRLADSIEKGKNFQIMVAGEKIHVPDAAIFNVEHEREKGAEELEFQVKWKKAA